MQDRPYTKLELDLKFQNLADKIDQKHDETLESIRVLSVRNDDKHLQNTDRLENIEVKVTTTNGKVRKLEIFTRGLVMAGSVALFMGGIIVGLIVYIYQYQLQQQATRITNLNAKIQVLQSK